MKLYHASEAEFDEFDINYAGSVKGKARNSQLGLWFALTPEWLSHKFGFNIYEVEVDECKTYIMPLAELRELSDKQDDALDDDVSDPDYWIKIRESFLEKGYRRIALQEQSKNDYTDENRISMYIILDDTLIHDVQLIKRLDDEVSFRM